MKLYFQVSEEYLQENNNISVYLVTRIFYIIISSLFWLMKGNFDRYVKQCVDQENRKEEWRIQFVGKPLSQKQHIINIMDRITMVGLTPVEMYKSLSN